MSQFASLNKGFHETYGCWITFAALRGAGLGKEVTIGYRTWSCRTDRAGSAGNREATGYKVNWKQFGGGGEGSRRWSGAVQIGEAGSAGIAAAVPR
jgi:taurine transport system substrate-binding protein